MAKHLRLPCLAQAIAASDPFHGLLDTMNRQPMGGPFGHKQSWAVVLALGQIAVDPNPRFRPQIDFPLFIAFA